MPAEPLTYEQMVRVVERRGGDIPRVPLFWHKVYNHATVERHGADLAALDPTIVDDCISLAYVAPGNFAAPEGADEGYVWAIEPDPGDLAAQGVTSRHVVSSTDLIDKFVARIPRPERPEYFASAREAVRANPGRYCVAWDFFCLFERSWFLFGMEDILCEMLWRPDRMARLLRAFTDYHKSVMDGFADAGAHAYFTSDDLGTQTGLIFSRHLFRRQYLPRYEELVDHCHSRGMHFWFHCCGAVTDILDDFCAVGMDVVHPIQPVAMDQADVARRYRGKLSFLAGIDVQYLLPGGSPEEVADGTRALVDAFDHEEGGCILAASNGIMPETPLENIAAWLQTAESYGAEKRASY